MIHWLEHKLEFAIFQALASDVSQLPLRDSQLPHRSLMADTLIPSPTDRRTALPTNEKQYYTQIFMSLLPRQQQSFHRTSQTQYSHPSTLSTAQSEPQALRDHFAFPRLRDPLLSTPGWQPAPDRFRTAHVAEQVNCVQEIPS